MRISIGAIAIPLFVCICCAPPPSVAPAPSAAAARDVDSARILVRALVERQRLPGFAITVSIGESSVWREGFGFADVNASVKATPESKFRIGSVSKLLTAALLMRLVERQRVQLDAPIGQYLTLPPPLRTVTLRQLAGHRPATGHGDGLQCVRAVGERDALAIASILLADSRTTPTPPNGR